MLGGAVYIKTINKDGGEEKERKKKRQKDEKDKFRLYDKICSTSLATEFDQKKKKSIQ